MQFRITNKSFRGSMQWWRTSQICIFHDQKRLSHFSRFFLIKGYTKRPNLHFPHSSNFSRLSCIKSSRFFCAEQIWDGSRLEYTQKRRQTFNMKARDNSWFRLCSKCAWKNAVYFRSKCTSTYSMADKVTCIIVLSVAERVHEHLSNVLLRLLPTHTTWRK